MLDTHIYYFMMHRTINLKAIKLFIQIHWTHPRKGKYPQNKDTKFQKWIQYLKENPLNELLHICTCQMVILLASDKRPVGCINSC
jgi:p-aminobenzoyl-glutamate transporter AbgT